MSEYIIDGIGVAGAGSITAGVYLQAGLGHALIVGGALVLGLALNAARLRNAAN